MGLKVHTNTKTFENLQLASFQNTGESEIFSDKYVTYNL